MTMYSMTSGVSDGSSSSRTRLWTRTTTLSTTAHTATMAMASATHCDIRIPPGLLTVLTVAPPLRYCAISLAHAAVRARSRPQHRHGEQRGHGDEQHRERQAPVMRGRSRGELRLLLRPLHGRR